MSQYTPSRQIKDLAFGQQAITIEDILAVANGQRNVELSQSPGFVERIDSGINFLNKLLTKDGVIYGVTTGYGDSCSVKIPLDIVSDLPINLTRFHGCGLGDYLSEAQARAVMAVRLNSLCQGYSGVSWELLDQLVQFINSGIIPRIPQEGSVGASGDLTPLSYVAGALIGEREVYYQGAVLPAKNAMAAEGITPLTLKPKEGLALMNGTAVMTALACEAFSRAQYLSRLCARITAISTVAVNGNPYHFDEILFSVKPHAGQMNAAKWIRLDLNEHEHPRNADRLQDRYSIRCAPHIIGVLEDTLPWLRSNIENELNSANDNPIIDGMGEHVLHGGHFYGGHIALAMDTLKNCVANLADLIDRQIALLVDEKFNHGLPANLSGAAPEQRYIHHGFKAVQIGASAWTAEALKLTMPALVFSRSTECHNQDKVSMGTIAARDCLRVLQLTEQVVAAGLLASLQGLRLREAQRELQLGTLGTSLQAMIHDLCSKIPFLEQDRPMESELRETVQLIQQQYWNLGYDERT
ncbi:MAG: aromatic amino acid ammonia-lyase [Pseudomonadales bacterium]|nr:aromatic amino acid ammonia-lyase [Pseudomonadales bacterium]